MISLVEVRKSILGQQCFSKQAFRCGCLKDAYAADKREINGDGSENNWAVDPWLTGPKLQLSSENIHRHRAATARCVINHCCQVSVTCTAHYHRILFLSLLRFHFTHFPHSRTINPHQKPLSHPAPVTLTQDCCKAQNG